MEKILKNLPNWKIYEDHKEKLFMCPRIEVYDEFQKEILGKDARMEGGEMVP